MKICFVSPLEGLHGGVRNIIQMANRLKEKGHDVYLVTDKIPVENPIDPINVPVVNEIGEPDIAIATWWPTVARVMNCQAKKKGYLVQHDESIGLSGEAHAAATMTYSVPMDFHIVIAPWLKEFIKEHGFYKIHQFIPPIKPEVMHPYGGKKDKMILYFSRPLERKHYKDGMWALKLIKDQRPDIEIVTFDSDPLLEKFDFVDRHILSPRDEVLGKLYSEATVYMQSTPIEGFGTLSLEALACGTVVVTPDKAGTAVFGEGVIQYVGMDISPLEIAEKCMWVVDHPEIRKGLEEEGIKRAAKITWDEEVNKLEQFLINL